MNTNLRNEKYNEYVEKKSPKTKNWPSLIKAFIVGGIICMIGQGINDFITANFKMLSETDVAAWTLVVIIFITTLLTGIGIFDKIGAFAGAGTIIPITGFANSIASPAIEFKREGFIFGLSAKMFIVAGPVIVNGVFLSAIAGLIHIFI